MTLFSFKAYDKNGHFDEWTLGGPTIEFGLDYLTDLTKNGWLLIEIKVAKPKDQSMLTLPVEIIDGAYFSEAIQRLKLEWEKVLLC